MEIPSKELQAEQAECLGADPEAVHSARSVT